MLKNRIDQAVAGILVNLARLVASPAFFGFRILRTKRVTALNTESTSSISEKKVVAV